MGKEFASVFLETKFPKGGSIKNILDNFEENKEVATAGRLIAKRDHGKSMFAHISDITAKLQVYAKLDILKEGYQVFTSLDVGDIIGVKGVLFKTRTGEPTLLVREVKLLAKSLKPLPEKWHRLKDVEVRYRQRYLDLISNPTSAQVFLGRSKVISFIRDFFAKEEYIEVETPMLHPLAGGASGKPFVTHHLSLDCDVYLRIAPELYLKRLLVGGFDKIYEINRSFRNEGLSSRHSPEFTMLEAYCAYQNYEYMMEVCEKLFSSLLEYLYGRLEINYQGYSIDFTPPWLRVSLAEILEEELGIKSSDSKEEAIKKMRNYLRKSKGEEVVSLSRSQLLNLTEDLMEKRYSRTKPVFVTDFFTWASPLAKRKKDNPNLVERFELFIAGLEIANGYSELNDPIEQRRRFEEHLEFEEDLPKKIDEDFILSLEYGMPPAVGLGIGIDRLVMLLFNQPSIKDVILFPLHRVR